MVDRPNDTDGPAGKRAGDQIEPLRHENELLETLLGAASELVAIVALDGTLVRSFRARGRPLNYPPEEIDGRNIFELIHPEDIGAARASLARLVDDGVATEVQLRLRRSDGTWVPMECVAENRNQDPLVRGIVVCARDVSARLELERKLQLAQRLESVGRLASGIVHDFNNVLSLILFNVDKASRAAAGQVHDEGAEALREIARAAARGAGATKRLLSLVRDRPVRARIVDLGELIGAVEATLRSLLPDEVKLEVVSEGVPLPVFADPAELEHVLLNLVLNARDAMPRGGSIRVAVRLDRDPGSERMTVILEVQDDGQGMDAATQGRAFEPFFTTKSAERGTGLGLWTVQDVVSRRGGSVELVSAPGQGSTIRVRLPLASQPAPLEAKAASSLRIASPLRVLLVDDEPRLLELLRGALEAAGYAVHTAGDGVEALELVDRMGMRPDLLVTDVSMPRLGGRQLAERLRARCPELPVLLISGLTHSTEEPDRDERLALLPKPFSSEELLAALASLVPPNRGRR
jgi:PAS domain S-box-containing protein